MPDENARDSLSEEMGAQREDAFDEDVDQQISRMMGEGGVAPPLRPQVWRDWAEDKVELKQDNEGAETD